MGVEGFIGVREAVKDAKKGTVRRPRFWFLGERGLFAEVGKRFFLLAESLELLVGEVAVGFEGFGVGFLEVLLVAGVGFPVGEGVGAFADVVLVEEVVGSDGDVAEGVGAAFVVFGDVEGCVEDVFLDGLIVEQDGCEAFADPGFWGCDVEEVDEGGGDVGV